MFLWQNEIASVSELLLESLGVSLEMDPFHIFTQVSGWRQWIIVALYMIVYQQRFLKINNREKS